MVCDTIKYKVVQNPQTKDLTLQIYRPINDTEWFMIDHLNEITPKELKCLCEYIHSLFNKKES